MVEPQPKEVAEVFLTIATFQWQSRYRTALSSLTDPGSYQVTVVRTLKPVVLNTLNTIIITTTKIIKIKR